MTFSHEPPLTRREARLREEARRRKEVPGDGHAPRAPSSSGTGDVTTRIPSPAQPKKSSAQPKKSPAQPAEAEAQMPVPAAFSRRAGRAERERLFTQSNPVVTAEMQAAAEAEAIAQAEALAVAGDVPGEKLDVDGATPSRPLTRRELRERELRKNAKSTPASGESSEAPLKPHSAVPPESVAVPPESVTFHGETVPLFTPVGEEDVPGDSPTFGSVPGLRGVDNAPQPLHVPEAVWAESSADSERTPQAETDLDSDLLVSFTSGSTLTTSALVLPTIPAGDATRPFNHTGEILITGSIDLPRSLASRGYPSAQFENTELDSLFAGEDAEAPSDSSPVRASKAVSSHTSTHDVISVKKPASHRLPVVLMVTAIVLAVGVAALAVVGVVTGVF